MVAFPDRLSLDPVFIEADIEQVASYFRGLLLMRNYNAEHGCGLDVRSYRILRGADAKFGEDVGQIEQYRYLRHDWARNFYAVWGEARIARVSSSPNLVVVEFGGGIPPSQQFVEMNKFLQCPILEIQSWIGLDKRYVNLFQPAPEIVKEESFIHSFQYHGERHRFVSALREGTRYKFDQSGTPLPFENPDHYTRRLIKDRLNRDIIVEYMEALGVDTEGVFLRGEVEDVMLFTEGDAGEDFSDRTDDLERYLSVFPETDHPRLEGKVLD